MLDLQPGAVIGGYQIRRKLGQGGMGAVYLAHDHKLEVDRALKIIALSDSMLSRVDEQEYRTRFIREARTLARLRHPGIIAVQVVDEVDDNLYIVMEFFKGSDLRTWLFEAMPGPDVVLSIGRQIASALAHAHDADIIHRDLKLSNILINEKNEIALIDFGLAKAPDHERLTQTGRSMGTFSYMAPEYVQAAMAGERCEHTKLSDLWAVGCVLYALLGYRMAFHDNDEMSLLGKIVKADVEPLASIRDDVAPAFLTAVHRLLERDPQKRTPSAQALLQELDGIARADVEGVPRFIPGVQRPRKEASTVRSKPEEAQSVSPSQIVGAPSSSENPYLPSDGGPVSAFADDSFLVPLPSVGVSLAKPVSSASSLPQAEVPAEPSGYSAFGAALAAPGPATPAAASPAAAVPAPLAAASPGIPAAASLAAAVPAPPSVLALGTSSSSEIGLSEPPTPSVPAAPAFLPPAAPVAGKTIALRNLLLPAIGAAIVLGIGITVIEATPSPKASTAFVDPEEAQRKRSGEAELRALEQASVMPEVRYPAPVAAPAAAVVAAAEPAQAPVAAPATTATSPGTRRGPRAGPASANAAAEAPDPDDPWAARYGGRTDFNTAAVKASGDSVASSASEPAKTSSGTRLPVRLDSTVASSPSGPVIAVLTTAAELDGVPLPAGTQLHGVTEGAQGTRLLVRFQFAKTRSGQHALRGVAMGTDGRTGIPGVKTLGGVTDVGAGAVQGAVDSTAGIIADVVGDNPAGAAIRGAGNASRMKSDRLNSAEYVVEAKRGTRFTAYVDAFGGGR